MVSLLAKDPGFKNVVWKCHLVLKGIRRATFHLPCSKASFVWLDTKLQHINIDMLQSQLPSLI